MGRDRGGWRSSGPGRSSSRETDSRRFPGTRRPPTSTELLPDNNNSSSSSSQLLSSTHSNRDQTLTPGGDNPSSNHSSSSNAHSCRLRISSLWETNSSPSSPSQ